MSPISAKSFLQLEISEIEFAKPFKYFFTFCIDDGAKIRSDICQESSQPKLKKPVLLLPVPNSAATVNLAYVMKNKEDTIKVGPDSNYCGFNFRINISDLPKSCHCASFHLIYSKHSKIEDVNDA